MAEQMENTWSSNIGDYGAYWDDIMDVHGWWFEAEENPDEAEYTLEQLRESVFQVSDFVDWLIAHQEEGWSIDGVSVWKGDVLDPTTDAHTLDEELVEVTRITVQFSRSEQNDNDGKSHNEVTP